VSNKEVTETTEGTTVAFDIELTKNGEKAPAGTYTVSINVGKNLNIAAVTHKGEAVTNYDYDLTTGVITFTTTNFSPFAVTYTSAKATGIEDLVAMLEAGKSAVLTADVDMSKAAVKNKAIVIPENSNVTLDLSGHTLTSKDGGGKNTMAIKVERGATLTIEDTVGGGEIVASCYGIYVQPNAKLVMNGGKLTVHGNGVYDMAVVLWNAEFVMNAGEIDANYGVYASNYWKENGEPDAMTCKVTINDAKSTITAKAVAIYTDEAPDTVVTKIVSTADQLTNALTAGGNVILAADITLGSNITVPAGVTATLDLNGKTVIYNSTTQGEAMITNKGTLTINDSVGTGVINYDYTGAADPNYGKGNYTISNQGTLTVNGGKITIANLSRHAKYPIDNNSTSGDAVLVINGGHLYNYNTSAIRQFCNSTTNKNSVTINGGLIEGYSAIWMQNPGKNTVNGSLTVNGGEIRSTAKAYVEGTAELKDVSSKIYCTIAGNGGAWSADSFVSITGGIFNENVNFAANAPAVTIGEGATFNGNLLK